MHSVILIFPFRQIHIIKEMKITRPKIYYYMGWAVFLYFISAKNLAGGQKLKANITWAFSI